MSSSEVSSLSLSPSYTPEDGGRASKAQETATPSTASPTPVGSLSGVPKGTSRVFCASWLHKQAEWRIGAWDPRYCQLEGSRMEYRVAQHDAPKKTGTVISVERLPVSREEYSFRVWLLEGGSWTLKASTVEGFNMWMRALETAVAGPTPRAIPAGPTRGVTGTPSSQAIADLTPASLTTTHATAPPLESGPTVLPTPSVSDPSATLDITRPVGEVGDTMMRATTTLSSSSSLFSSVAVGSAPLQESPMPQPMWYIPPPPGSATALYTSSRFGDPNAGGGPAAGTLYSMHSSAALHNVLLTAMVEKQGAWTRKWNTRALELRGGGQLVYRAVNGEARKRFFLTGVDRAPTSGGELASQEQTYLLFSASTGERFWVRFFSAVVCEQWFRLVRAEMKHHIPWHCFPVEPPPPHLVVDPVLSRGITAMHEIEKSGPHADATPGHLPSEGSVEPTGGTKWTDSTTTSGAPMGGTHEAVYHPPATTSDVGKGGGGWWNVLGRLLDGRHSLLFSLGTPGVSSSTDAALLHVHYHAAALVDTAHAPYSPSLFVYGGCTQYTLARPLKTSSGAVYHPPSVPSMSSSTPSVAGASPPFREAKREPDRWMLPTASYTSLSSACVCLSLRGVLSVTVVDAEPFAPQRSVKVKPPPLYGATLTPILMDHSFSMRHAYTSSTRVQGLAKEEMWVMLVGGFTGTPQRLPHTDLWGLGLPAITNLSGRSHPPPYWVRWQVPSSLLPPLAFHSAVPIHFSSFPSGSTSSMVSSSALAHSVGSSDLSHATTTEHHTAAHPSHPYPNETSATTPWLSKDILFVTGGVSETLQPVADTYCIVWHTSPPSEGGKEKVVVYRGPALPTPRAFHGSAVLKHGTIVVIGGRGNDSAPSMQRNHHSLARPTSTASAKEGDESTTWDSILTLSPVCSSSSPEDMAVRVPSFFHGSSGWQPVRWDPTSGPLPLLHEVAVCLAPSGEEVVILSQRQRNTSATSTASERNRRLATQPTSPFPLPPATASVAPPSVSTLESSSSSLSHSTSSSTVTVDRAVKPSTHLHTSSAQLFLVRFTEPSHDLPSQQGGEPERCPLAASTLLPNGIVTARWREVPLRMGVVPQLVAGSSIHVYDGYVYLLGGAQLSSERLPSFSGPVRILME